MAPGRPSPVDLPGERGEIPDRLCSLHGFSSIARPVFQPDHVPPIFLDEETAVAKALRGRAAGRAPMGSRLPKSFATGLGGPARQLRLVDCDARVHRALPVGFSSARSEVMS